MIIRSQNDVSAEQVTMYGSTGTYIQVLLGENEGTPNFIMRRFVVEKGGQIGMHDHWYEHEIYVLSGKGNLIDEQGNRTPVKAGDAILVPQGALHGYEAPEEDVAFLCMIPHPKHEP